MQRHGREDRLRVGGPGVPDEVIEHPLRLGETMGFAGREPGPVLELHAVVEVQRKTVFGQRFQGVLEPAEPQAGAEGEEAEERLPRAGVCAGGQVALQDGTRPGMVAAGGVRSRKAQEASPSPSPCLRLPCERAHRLEGRLCAGFVPGTAQRLAQQEPRPPRAGCVRTVPRPRGRLRRRLAGRGHVAHCQQRLREGQQPFAEPEAGLEASRSCSTERRSWGRADTRIPPPIRERPQVAYGQGGPAGVADLPSEHLLAAELGLRVLEVSSAWATAPRLPVATVSPTESRLTRQVHELPVVRAGAREVGRVPRQRTGHAVCDPQGLRVAEVLRKRELTLGERDGLFLPTTLNEDARNVAQRGAHRQVVRGLLGDGETPPMAVERALRVAGRIVDVAERCQHTPLVAAVSEALACSSSAGFSSARASS